MQAEMSEGDVRELELEAAPGFGVEGLDAMLGIYGEGLVGLDGFNTARERLALRGWDVHLVQMLRDALDAGAAPVDAALVVVDVVDGGHAGSDPWWSANDVDHAHLVIAALACQQDDIPHPDVNEETRIGSAVMLLAHMMRWQTHPWTPPALDLVWEVYSRHGAASVARFMSEVQAGLAALTSPTSAEACA